MKNILAFLLLSIFCFPVNGFSNPSIDTLFENSYKVFELQRLPNGMYRDSKLFSGADYHPVSISNTGMGLISLCIADAMGWISNAKDLAIITLQTANGHHPDFVPDRTSNGFFRHFLDINTGEQAWNSEYSTIDTDILMAGALFCMNYFQDDEIRENAMELWHSIDFEAAISNPTTGKIFLTMNANGSGTNALTSPYSEYMIVAWFAKNASDSPSSIGNTLWNNFYESPDLLPSVAYNGIEVLSDNANSFLSSFTHLFNYYLCNHFTVSDDYNIFFKNAQEAELAWWNTTNSEDYEWGLGAGSAITNSYQANSINQNIDTIVSPHIIAGFLPVNPDGKNNLIEMWNNGKGKYSLPLSTSDSILWRYSKVDPSWQPNELIGIDHSTMLFGLATLPEYLGDDFFRTNNDFFPTGFTNTVELEQENSLKIFPNPSNTSIRVSGLTRTSEYTIYDVFGRAIQSGSVLNNEEIEVYNLKSGVYLIDFENGRSTKFIKK